MPLARFLTMGPDCRCAVASSSGRPITPCCEPWSDGQPDTIYLSLSVIGGPNATCLGQAPIEDLPLTLGTLGVFSGWGIGATSGPAIAWNVLCGLSLSCSLIGGWRLATWSTCGAFLLQTFDLPPEAVLSCAPFHLLTDLELDVFNADSICGDCTDFDPAVVRLEAMQ